MKARVILALLAALAVAAAGCSESTDPARTDGGFRKTIDIVAVGLGGMAWVDNDGDGIRGMGDFGLAGVEVHLLDCAGTPLDTMITDPAGQYGFGGLAPGDYAIGFVLPDGYAFSPQDQGEDPDADSDADPVTGVTACITLADEELDLTVDAGLVPVVAPLGAVGDLVWLDADGDGLQDEGEAGLGGVEVRLWECAGAVLDTTCSAADGSYAFSDLPAGDYMLQFVLPEGYAFSPGLAAADTTLDSDPDPVTGITACFTLGEGAQDPTRDAGLIMLPVGENCTYGKGYWKTHTGCVRGEDRVSDLLPQHLGTPGGTLTLEVSDPCEAFAVLSGFPYCVDKCGRRPDMSNGIVKLYAHLLATKLNIAHGADDADIAATVADADAFLADHDWHAWDGLDQDTRHLILDWKDALEDYNEGRTGPGHCDHCGDGDDDDDHDDDDDDGDDDDDDR